MAIYTVGAAGTYATITLASDAIKLLAKPWLEEHFIHLLDDANFPLTNNDTLNFGSGRGGFRAGVIAVGAGAVNNGSFLNAAGSGARIFGAFTGGLLTINDTDFTDILLGNDSTVTNGEISNNARGHFLRCRCNVGPNARTNLNLSAGGITSTIMCRFNGGLVGLESRNTSSRILFNQVTNVSGIGINLTTDSTSAGEVRNNTIIGGTGFGGVASITNASNNASDVAAGIPGTNPIVLVGNQYEANGITPLAGSQLDGSAVVVADVLVDIFNATLTVPPSIGVANASTGAVTPPTVGAGGPYSGNVATPIQLSAAIVVGTDPNPVIVWTIQSGGTGVFSNAAIFNPTVTLDGTGLHVVRCTVTPNDGPAVFSEANVTANAVIANIAILRRRRTE